MIHTIRDFRGEKKKQVRATILMIIGKRREEIRQIEEGIIKPLKDDLESLKWFLFGKGSLEEIIKNSEMINKRLKEFFETKRKV